MPKHPLLGAICIAIAMTLFPPLSHKSNIAHAASSAPSSFAELAEKLRGAVVNITTSTLVEARMQGFDMMPPGNPFEEFFRDFMERNVPEQGHKQKKKPRSRRSNALGSGFVISEDGYIVTNNHVIEGADDIKIEFLSGETLEAELIGTDPNTDIALLKVESDTSLPYVTFGDSDEERVGDWVIAMGNPLGQGFSVSAGIISARNRALSGSYDDFIQTDAAINRGNSGGPLFNMDGEVIGVNTAILSPNGGSIGIGFSMASNVVSKVIDQLKEFGETKRGWLGVQIQDLTTDVADAMALGDIKGVLVTDLPEGPARNAGIMAGDIIIRFDGNIVEDTRDLTRQVGDAAVGTSVTVLIIRQGKELEIDVTLGRREDIEAAALNSSKGRNKPEEKKALLGLHVKTLTNKDKEAMQLSDKTNGLLITGVEPLSEAYEKGLRPGDIITEANQEKVSSNKELSQMITEVKDAGRKSILLMVRRNDNPRFLALSVE